MQRHQILGCVSLFTLVFIFFILPPLFVSPETEKTLFSEWSFPLSQLLSFVSIFLAGFLQKKLFTEKNEKAVFLEKSEKSRNSEKRDFSEKSETPKNPEKCKKKEKPAARTGFVLDSSFFLTSFGSLCLVSAFFQGIAFLSGKDMSQNIARPEKLEWIFCVLNFLLSAASEEILYRFFLPESLAFFSGFAKKERTKKILASFSEILSALAFALSHRYLGFLSVMNAFFAHGILRFCCKKTGKLRLNVLSHFLYNFLSLLVFVFA